MHFAVGDDLVGFDEFNVTKDAVKCDVSWARFGGFDRWDDLAAVAVELCDQHWFGVGAENGAGFKGLGGSHSEFADEFHICLSLA